MFTTLNQIRAHSPCQSGWKKLLHSLEKTQADDAPVKITTIIDSNGLDDALWCLRAVQGYDKEKRLYAVWCARQVEHLMTDKRSLEVLRVAEAFALGLSTPQELAAAWDAAGDAAGDAAVAASRAAAWDAAGDAAGDAAVAASRAAAWDAAWDAARAAAWAAWAAWATAGTAAWAAWAAGAARDAAWAAARAAQEKELRRVCAKIEKENQ